MWIPWINIFNRLFVVRGSIFNNIMKKYSREQEHDTAQTIQNESALLYFNSAVLKS